MDPKRYEKQGDPSGTRPAQMNRALVMVGMMLLTALIAMDQTIVATALPTIVSSLGGFTQFPWVFSAYLLTMAVTIPLYGKLADHFGRKRLIVFGGGLFVAGSVLAGVSWNMTSLIVFRALQGLGAGAVRPLTVTIIGDIYTTEERGRIQGLIGAVWGVSAVAGPLIGGLFSEFIGWRWIFFVNIPTGIMAVLVVWRFFHERIERRDTAVDLLGAGLLALGIGAIVLTLLQAGSGWAWRSPATISTGLAGLAVLACFVAWERRVANPILPFWVFKSRQLSGAVLATLVVGLITLAMAAYVPTLAQGVYGASPVVAGGLLGLMSIGWPLASAFSARIYGPIGFRDTALIGVLLILAGAGICAGIPRGGSLGLLAGPVFVLGMGLGLVSTPLIVGAQSVVDWGRRGAVTGAVTFGQMFGSTMSTAIFGGLFNSSLARWLSQAPPSLQALAPTPDRVANLLERGGGIPVPLLDLIRSGLYGAVHQVFAGLVVAGLAAGVVLIATPRKFEFVQS